MEKGGINATFGGMKSTVFLLVFAGLFAAGSKAQQAPDTILLLTGKYILGEVKGERDGFIEYIPYSEKPKKKTRSKGIAPLNVFAIYFANGNDSIVYQQDEANDLYLTREEMQLFIYGQQDAREHYKTIWWGVAGGAIGLAGGYFFYNKFYVVAVPAAYIAVSALTRIKVSKGVRSVDLSKEPAYQEGYLKVARNKKVVSATIGVVAGTAAGMGLGFIVN